MQGNRLALELWCLNSSINLKNPRAPFSFKEQFFFVRGIAIDGSDEVSFGKSVHLNDDRSIGDERLRCVHISRVKRCVALIHPLDLHPTIAIPRGVHRSRLILAIITPLTDGRDYFT